MLEGRPWREGSEDESQQASTWSRSISGSWGGVSTPCVVNTALPLACVSLEVGVGPSSVPIPSPVVCQPHRIDGRPESGGTRVCEGHVTDHSAPSLLLCLLCHIE